MLTKVYLEGPMGKEFGREWEFEINSPREALLMVDANKPGLIGWLRLNAEKYTHYQIIVEYEDGQEEALSDDTFILERKMASIRFVPIIEGAGKWGQAIVGVVIMIVGVVYGYWTGDWSTATSIIKFGAGMMISGVIAALTVKSSNVKLAPQGAEAKSLASAAFDGPTNTAQQGIPVPLIYGRCLVGSQVISAGLTVDQMI